MGGGVGSGCGYRPRILGLIVESERDLLDKE